MMTLNNIARTVVGLSLLFTVAIGFASAQETAIVELERVVAATPQNGMAWITWFFSLRVWIRIGRFGGILAAQDPSS